MGLYGKAAVAAYDDLIHGNMKANEAWKCQVRNLTKSIASQKKSCPKQTFLAAINLIQDYQAEGGNHNMVREALKIIQKDESIIDNKNKLWRILFPCGKANNQQLDVIIGLWKRGCFNNMDINEAR